MVDDLFQAAGCFVGTIMLVLTVVALGMVAVEVLAFVKTNTLDLSNLFIAGVLLMVVGIYATRN